MDEDYPNSLPSPPPPPVYMPATQARLDRVEVGNGEHIKNNNIEKYPKPYVH